MDELQTLQEIKALKPGEVLSIDGEDWEILSVMNKTQIFCREVGEPETQQPFYIDDLILNKTSN
jgi:hypothetical protein